MTWEQEHLVDPFDDADAFFVMEDGTICIPHECASCLRVPCICEEEPPARFRRYRPAQHEPMEKL